MYACELLILSRWIVHVNCITWPSLELNNSYTHTPRSLQILQTRRPEAVEHERSEGTIQGPEGL